jgi:hypothetical protein
LLSRIVPSDHCFDGFISPMTNPVFFEDPRTLTEVRSIYAYQNVPNRTGGGDIDLFTEQLRVALNDYVSIIVPKDGYITSNNPLIKDGWADVSGGLKINFLRDVENQRLASAGIVYEIPVGSHQALQGTSGGGDWDLFFSGGAQIGCDWHYLTTTGITIADDPNKNSEFWYWSNHLDRKIGDNFYVLTEVNWFHWYRSGANTATSGVEGLDFFNFGSSGVGSANIITLAPGAKYKPNDNLELGIAYEIPVTERRDVIQNRLTLDMIIRY